MGTKPKLILITVIQHTVHAPAIIGMAGTPSFSPVNFSNIYKMISSLDILLGPPFSSVSLCQLFTFLPKGSPISSFSYLFFISSISSIISLLKYKCMHAFIYSFIFKHGKLHCNYAWSKWANDP